MSGKAELPNYLWDQGPVIDFLTYRNRRIVYHLFGLKRRFVCPFVNRRLFVLFVKGIMDNIVTGKEIEHLRFEQFFLRSVNECGADFLWKYSQDTALQEILRRNSVRYF